MDLVDLDFILEHEHGSIRLSELTPEDMIQIRKIVEAINKEKIFDDELKSVLAAFQLFAESHRQFRLENWIL